MNGKVAKRLRKAAKILERQFIKERVLTEEMLASCTEKELDNILPKSSLLMQAKTRYQAFGTRRFFIRAVKKRPGITYQELAEAVYGNS